MSSVMPNIQQTNATNLISALEVEIQLLSGEKMKRFFQISKGFGTRGESRNEDTQEILHLGEMSSTTVVTGVNTEYTFEGYAMPNDPLNGLITQQSLDGMMNIQSRLLTIYASEPFIKRDAQGNQQPGIFKGFVAPVKYTPAPPTSNAKEQWNTSFTLSEDGDKQAVWAELEADEHDRMFWLIESLRATGSPIVYEQADRSFAINPAPNQPSEEPATPAPVEPDPQPEPEPEENEDD